MPHRSDRLASPWIAFAAGAVAVAAILLMSLAWPHGDGGSLRFAMRDVAPSLPSLPRMPEGPQVPHPPIPTPK
jgi:hypothetical protein